MAFGKAYASVDEVYAFKLIDHFYAISMIRNGEDKLQSAISGEFFCWPFLEGSGYVESKRRLYEYVDEELKKGKVHSTLNLADAILKLQQRAASDAGIYGKKGLTVYTSRSLTGSNGANIKEDEPTSEEDAPE